MYCQGLQTRHANLQGFLPFLGDFGTQDNGNRNRRGKKQPCVPNMGNENKNRRVQKQPRVPNVDKGFGNKRCKTQARVPNMEEGTSTRRQLEYSTPKPANITYPPPDFEYTQCLEDLEGNRDAVRRRIDFCDSMFDETCPTPCAPSYERTNDTSSMLSSREVEYYDEDYEKRRWMKYNSPNSLTYPPLDTGHREYRDCVPLNDPVYRRINFSSSMFDENCPPTPGTSQRQFVNVQGSGSTSFATPEAEYCNEDNQMEDDYDDVDDYEDAEAGFVDVPQTQLPQYQLCEGQQTFEDSLDYRPSFAAPGVCNSTTYLESCQTMQPLGRFLSIDYSSEIDDTAEGERLYDAPAWEEDMQGDVPPCEGNIESDLPPCEGNVQGDLPPCEGEDSGENEEMDGKGMIDNLYLSLLEKIVRASELLSTLQDLDNNLEDTFLGMILHLHEIRKILMQ